MITQKPDNVKAMLRAIAIEVDEGWVADPRPTTRDEYLACLKLLSGITDWHKARIGVLKCEISGRDGHGWCYAYTKVLSSFDETMGLLPRAEVRTLAQARTQAIAHMRAWVKQSKGFAPHPGAPTPGEGTHGAGPDKTN
jgi:hypothetical protein